MTNRGFNSTKGVSRPKVSDKSKPKKKQNLRNNEYYDTQTVFDTLYVQSKQNKNFTDLMSIITSRENILLAYRTIKRNGESKTAGTNNHTIKDIAKYSSDEFVEYVRFRLSNFKPHSVRRVEIEKESGGKRPLGIPTIEDRIIQQCIKQVLEPICEAKFYYHSYGFRPNRSAHYAMSRSYFLAQRAGYQFVVDIDIKGFFDNVNHAKLIKQMWAMGIRDKNLICVIGKMLKAEIRGVGIPTKGVPQGGILSPLLSNIVLNELDWWIANQWEYFKTEREYTCKNSRMLMLKITSKLKKIYIVRYADDFKIFCKDPNEAQRIFIATQKWLKERLGLDISSEKSKVINLKKKYSEFLGFKMKLHPKCKKWVIKSKIRDKAIDKIKRNLLQQIKEIQQSTTLRSVAKYNACVLGLHSYYKVATGVNLDFAKIAFVVGKALKSRLKLRFSKTGRKSNAFKKFYDHYGGKIRYIDKVALFPIAGVTHEWSNGFSQDICNYTKEGRDKIHKLQKAVDRGILKYIMENPVEGRSTEYNDNRVSLYVGQGGKCFVTRKSLIIGKMHTHHKKPVHLGGGDEYSNLCFVEKDVHKLIHATNEETINNYLVKLNLKTQEIAKLNKLRLLAQNPEL